MSHWVYVAIFVLIVIVLDQIADRIKATADERRTKRLVERAKREFPHNALTESLGELHAEIREEIVLANIEGRRIDRFVRDRELIATEVCHLWQEEIDRKGKAIEAGSSFKVTPAGALTARQVRIRMFKNPIPSTLRNNPEKGL